MKYFKNPELSKIHNVSDKAIRNWIEAARQGKSDLSIVEANGRFFVADSLHNNLLIEELVQKGKKYKNKRNHKDIKPSAEFYKTYSPGQVIDIASNLDKYREIPSCYRYVGKSANLWDNHLHRLHQTGTSNMLTATIELLGLERGYFDALLKGHEYVNLIDLGVGNGLAAKDILEYLHSTGKLNRYIGIDSSRELLDITEHNINSWFNSAISVEKYCKDITHERFTEIAQSNSLGENTTDNINIILFLGGTIGNFREPSQALKTIRDSMGKDDVLITSYEFDSQNARSRFGTNNTESFSTIMQRNTFLMGQLGFSEDCYDIEWTFDNSIKSYLVQARLKQEITIVFDIGVFKKTLNFQRGDTIQLLRMRKWTDNELMDLYEKNGLSQLRTTKLRDQEFVLLVSQVNTETRHPVQP
ncbi:MAG TPA: L-histidine N(alpha)-methyltransferase [Candidatus Saccharimonadales bacterium]